MLGDDVGGDVVDVLAAVAVLRCVLSAGGREEGPGEPVDLCPVVVEVVLAGDVGAGEGEESAERVAHGGPAHAADVDRTGGVGADELEVHLLAGVEVAAAVVGSALQHLLGDLSLGGGGDPQVEEPGPGDLGRADAVVLGKDGGQVCGQVARAQPGLLAQLQRDVRGVVAVLLDLRTLDAHLRRQAVGQAQTTLVGEPGEGGHDHVAELLGSHPASLSSSDAPPRRGNDPQVRPRQSCARWRMTSRTVATRKSGSKGLVT